MDFIDIAHCIMLLAHVQNFGDRSDIAIHRIDALERDQLGLVGIELTQLAVQVFGRIMFPDDALGAAVPDALDHRGVVERIGQDHAVRDACRQGAEGGPVGDIAGREDQRVFLAVQIGQFVFQQDMMMVGARNIARAPCPGAAFVDHPVHRFGYLGMLAHAEIIVGAPDRDLGGAVFHIAGSMGIGASLAFDLGEHPVTALFPDRIQFAAKKCFIIHAQTPSSNFFLLFWFAQGPLPKTGIAKRDRAEKMFQCCQQRQTAKQSCTDGFMSRAGLHCGKSEI